MILLVLLAGVAVYFIIVALVTAAIWMLTTFVGLFFLALFVLGVVANLINQAVEDRKNREEDE